MAFAETAPLIAQLDLKGNFTPNLKRASSALSSFASRMDSTSVRFQRAGQQIGTGIRNIGLIAATAVGALATQVAAGLRSLIELEQATAQTEAVIKSTGGVAGVTAAEVGRLSEKWEGLNATVGDEFVRAGANMLLTFTNIRGKAFEPALASILDLNTALGKGPEGLTGTAILVGKALNDPIRGLTALRRVGVQLNEAQEKQIRTLVEQNDLYGAQQVIIKELNKEFGGSFIAQGNTTAGKVAKFTDSIEDLQRALAEALLPTLGNVADALTLTLADPSVVQGVKDFGKSLAGLVSPANLATAGRIIQDVFSAAKSAAPVIAAAAKTMFSVVSAAVNVFSSLPKEIQQLAIGAFAINKLTGGLVTNIAGGLIGAVLKQLVAGVVNVRGATVIVTGAAGLPVGGAGAAGGALGLASKVFLVGEAIGLALLVNEVRNGIAEGNTQFAKSLAEQNQAWLAQNPSKADLKNGLAAVEAGILEIARTDPQGFVSGESLAELKGIRLAILGRIANPNGPLGPATPVGPPTPANLRNMSFGSGGRELRSTFSIDAAIQRGLAAGFKPTRAAAEATVQRNLERLAAANLAATNRVRDAAASGAAASLVTAAAVQNMDRKPPITNVEVNVNVTAAQVNKSVVIQQRFGPSGGSRARGAMPGDSGV